MHINYITENYLQERKNQIRDEVDRVLQYIDFQKSRTETRIMENIRNRVNEAFTVADNINETNREKPLSVRKFLVREALRPVRFNNGRGYYFANRMDGTNELFADRPETEGRSLLGQKDTQGRHVVKEQIDLVEKKGEGFHRYTWTKPGLASTGFEKIAFVKYFAPFDWYLGTGEYIEDMEKDIRKEVLDWIGKIRFGKDGYIFVMKNDGYYLSHLNEEFIGQNLIDVTDPNGIKINRELLRVATGTGGYVEYSWIKPSIGKTTPKLAFARMAPKWDWMVGTGIYMDDLQEQIERLRESHRSEMTFTLYIWLFALLGLACAILYTLKRISASIGNEVYSFIDFFRLATSGDRKIDTRKLRYDEFRDMAAYANEMVHERSRIERKLDNTSGYLNSIIDSMPSIMIGTDRDFAITRWNRKAGEFTGIAPEHAAGMSLFDALPQLAPLRKDMEHAIVSGEEQSSPKTPMEFGDKKLICDVMFYPVETESGKGAVVRIDDVTTRIRMEEALIQSEKMMTIGGLAAGMAHEINNPLGGILMSAQNITRRIDPGSESNKRAAEELGVELGKVVAYLEQRGITKFLAGIREMGERASRIVGNMLGFSRPSESRAENTDMPVLIDKAIDLIKSDYDLKRKYDFRSIEIVKDYENFLPRIYVTRNEIEQVLINIIENAAQAMREWKYDDDKPRIIIRIRQEVRFMRIEIEDNGPGMSDEVKKKIFEPFFTTKEVGKGTGLGLSVTYFIVANNHKGEIWVESEPGKGSRFIIRLPL